MADYPSALPSITRPAPDDKLSDPTPADVIDEVADELEAVAAGVGLPDGTTAGSAFEKIETHSHDGVDSAAVAVGDHLHDGDPGEGGTLLHANLADGADPPHHPETHDAGSAAHTGFLTPEMRGLEVGLSTADQSFTSSAVLANLTDLDGDVVAAGTYLIEALLWVQAGATGDVQVALTGPASPTRLRYQLIGPTETDADGFATNMQQNAAYATAFGTALIAGGLDANSLLLLKGLLVNGANSGIVRVQGAQKTSNATATIFRSGSLLRLERIA